ncbi:MAG: hypothetical protein HKN64_00905, partial [Woeseiaceae bacterium]|nr:hypothetical protein [Woeseiaceae bacterium]
MKKTLVTLTLSLAMLSCSQPDGESAEVKRIDALARDYLFLELAMGQHDPDHVDAYFGPAEIRSAAEDAALTLDDILDGAEKLAADLATLDTSGDRQLQQRLAGLQSRLVALDTRIALQQGVRLDFDEESLRLFGTQAPHYDAAHFDAILAQIDALLPGPGPLASRVNALNDAFDIPADKLPAVFEAAIAECRRRTLRHIQLPENESFTIEYVTDKPWSGYNWYKGD